MTEFDDLVRRIRSCTLCTLSEKRTQAVPGEGSRTADIMFIGEGPGFYEDRDGRPFVGQAGRLLDELLVSIDLNRESVYITNMIKCRAPNNRDPLPSEIQSCGPYLNEQIEMISPRIIVTLGRYSFGKFFPSQTISKARGRPQSWNGLVIYPIYHPAAALHNPGLKPALEQDFQNLKSLLEEPPAPATAPEPQAEQLSFF